MIPANNKGVRRRALRVSTATAALLLTVACVGDADEGASAVAGVVELDSPAGPGSAEPNLSPTEDGAVLSWLEPDGEDWALRVAHLKGGARSDAHTVVSRSDLFVNWADFPSVVPLGGGRLAAHWLQRGPEGSYDYGIRVSVSDDGGLTWTEPWTPHQDGTPTEHGFVTMVAEADGSLRMIWLDGRRYADGVDGPATEEMTLRSRVLGADGTPGPEVLVDDRTCDCCQTAMARTADGWLAVYRDRTEDEVRDVFAVRWVDGAWTAGVPVHRDGWTIAACPVNGPQVAAAGDHAAVAWFTGAGDVRRVLLAFSEDGGATFAEPTRLDGGRPVGRVDVELAPDGSALVTWVERVVDGAELRLVRARPGEPPEEHRVLALTAESRASGFPRMVTLPDGALLLAWTDVSGGESRVRVARVAVETS